MVVLDRMIHSMKDMVDYHDLYLKKDVLLLADVFKKFTSESLKFYKLDPSHYFSSLGSRHFYSFFNKF